MKLRIFILTTFICAFSANFFAQDKNVIDLSIDLNERTISINSKSFLVKLKLTNNSKEILYTRKLNPLTFQLRKGFESKLFTSPTAEADGYFNIKPGLIKQGESIEFEVDLFKIDWAKQSSSSVYLLGSKPEKPFLSGYYLLSARINDCEKLPVNKAFESKSSCKSYESDGVSIKIDAMLFDALEIVLESKISMKNATILTNSKDSPVNVKLTNLLSNNLDTKNLKYISFYLSKCGNNSFCSYQGNVFVGFGKIKSTTLKQNKPFEFKVNLADLSWNDEISSFRTSEKNFPTIPSADYFLYASIDGFLSNQIVVTVKSK